MGPTYELSKSDGVQILPLWSEMGSLNVKKYNVKFIFF